MARPKTTETGADVIEFIERVENNRRKSDALTLLESMTRITGESPAMWGPSIIGSGRYHYQYDSGHEGDGAMVSFSPRKQNLVVYIMPGFSGYQGHLDRLGKYRTGRSCLYVNKLDDIDLEVLEDLIRESFAEMQRRYK